LPSQNKLREEGAFADIVREVVGKELKEEWKGDLEKLLFDFSDIFNVADTIPANVEPIQVGIKNGYEGRVFYRPEPLRSEKEQLIIDENAKKLIKQGKARINPIF
jgi:hypothetical protein